MTRPAPRLPRQRTPRPAEPALAALVREATVDARRRVLLRLGDDLERVPVDAALEVATVVSLLLDHADHHHDDAAVVVALALDGDELRATVADDACAAGCAARAPQVDRVWSTGAGRRRCDVVPGPLGGVRVSWSAPVGQVSRETTAQRVG
ncbi:hypothetical protein [Nocardioides marmoribigeumensis]|uniref:Histidine kinase n=1 Tax=Nocardioides marmoribigeumensis TaxID=433649 RepID=A0ABU2BUC4_9ACTN|nr:hypothetical protein [Nocardioides marmoribigeumensis]MDR7361881.1 hypothetical protein [Nocardioides marmoribigeumensis]